MSGPLAGITVLDLSTVGPGARSTALLADLGATVVKVLAPAAAERIDPPFYAYGAGRGTKRVRIDLRAPGGRDAFLSLVARADVVVESYRPGVADRLGIGYPHCRERNDRIVYAALTGYGTSGPYARWAGHDLNYLALGGYLGMQTPRADGGPPIPGATVADSAGGGMQAAIAILAALVRRDGAFLDVSATDGVLSLMSLQIDQYLATGEEPHPGTELLTGGYACYECYECADGGWVAVAAIEPRFFANLCEGLDVRELAEAQMDRARQDEIRAAFRAVFKTRARDEWVEALAPADTCVAPVLSLAEVTRDPHLRARGVFSRAEHPQHGSFEQTARVIAGGGRPDVERAPDQSRTDTDELLRAAGSTGDEIARLRAEGVVE